MALAKYLEDLIESYLEGTDALINGNTGRDLEKEWQHKITTVSDAVALRGKDGVWWDDCLVFLTDHPVPFEIVAARADSNVNLRWQSERSGTTTTLRESAGSMELLSKHAVSGDVIATCGNYSKTYRVSFVTASRPENLPEFAAELAALTENPPTWTQSSFDRFRSATEAVLKAHHLPADFCEGVREYHLGLYHEQIGEGRFGARLDRAHTLLRPFVKHSRLAALICGYYLYRVNAFEQPLVRRAFARLGRVARFFSDKQDTEPTSPASGPSESANELIISALDKAIIAAIEHLDNGSPDLATAEMNRAESARCYADTQGLERTYFLRSEIYSKQNNLRDAAKYAALLANSSVSSFRSRAERQPTLTAGIQR